MNWDPTEQGAHPLGPARPLERLGPYRIEQHLGQGGMGAVYAAWDERLERREAVKLIRPESAASPAVRERFRREARAAAALNHPAVVQVYDVLAAEHGDAIVMEYVEGRTLAELLRTSAPSRDVALALAAQIADGLAAAHAQGIVHRDLKTENVMITPAGRAKVLDFGLARREQTGDPTTTGVMGTYRAMSPEQARALPIDHRSDLFSFGTLLYELFAGRSPFVATSPLETLTNVCAQTPPPLHEVDSALPRPLSALVEALLQKEPGRRPQDTAAVADTLHALLASSGGVSDAARRLAAWSHTAAPSPATPASAAADDPNSAPTAARVAATPRTPRRRGWVTAAAAFVVLGAGTAVWLGTRSRAVAPSGVAVPQVSEAVPPLSVAVPGPVLEGVTSEATETLRAGTRTAVLRGLLSLAGVVPVAPDVLDPVPASALDAARAVAADELVTARVACGAESCRVTLARLAVRDGSLLWTTAFETPTHEPALLPEVVLGHLRRAYPGHSPRPGPRALEVSPADFTEYLTLQRAFDSQGREGAPLADLDARLAALRERAPLFVEAGVLEAEILRRRFLDSRDRSLLERATAVLTRLRELAPDDPRPLAVLFEVALTREDLDGAERTLAELQRQEPGDPSVLMQRAQLLLRRQAAPERTLELVRLAVKRQPSYVHLLRAAQIEDRVGGAQGTQAARAHLEELLRRYPSYDRAQSMLAEIELLKGNPARAAELYGELVQRAPRSDVLTNLGVANLLLARYGAAERALRKAVRLEPADAVVALNLADVVLLQERVDEAHALYRRVLALTTADPTPGSWQMLSVLAQAHAHLGARREAAEALQRLLAVAGENPQAALDAAVTYAILGDDASTLASAARALRGGVEPRWLCLPWFQPLHAQPEFSELLPQGETCAAEAAQVPGRS